VAPRHSRARVSRSPPEAEKAEKAIYSQGVPAALVALAVRPAPSWSVPGVARHRLQVVPGAKVPITTLMVPLAVAAVDQQARGRLAGSAVPVRQVG
jgi:hypothetical protein